MLIMWQSKPVAIRSPSLKIAVISDVHGNAFALEAVLHELEQAAPDLIFNLGDQAEGGANPARAVALQAELGALEVRGNNEEKLWQGGRRTPLTQSYGLWLEQHVPAEALARLAALPLSLSADEGRIFACHGTPSSAWQSLLWSWEHGTQGQEGFYRSPDPRQLRELLAPLKAELVLCGHTHRAGTTRVDDTLVVNVGSISDQVDGDPRARWAVLERKNGQWSVDFRATDYDVNAAVAWAYQYSPFGDFTEQLLSKAVFDGRGDS